jgi:hypothetical protein
MFRLQKGVCFIAIGTHRVSIRLVWYFLCTFGVGVHLQQIKFCCIVSIYIVMYSWFACLIIVGSGLDLLALLSQLQSMITAHSECLPKTRSIPYWTTSVCEQTPLVRCYSGFQAVFTESLYSRWSYSSRSTVAPLLWCGETPNTKI